MRTRRRSHRWARCLVLGVLALAVPSCRQTSAPPDPVTGLTFHVDCRAGDDGADGRSPSTPWRTLGRASQATLHPGDGLRLVRGCTWTDDLLDIGWHGRAGSPITVGAYGVGATPRLRDGVYQNVRVRGSHVVVEDLDLSFGIRSRAACGQPLGDYSGIVFAPGSHDATIRRSVLASATQGVFISAGADRITVADNVIAGNNVLKVWNGDPEAALGAWGVLVNGDDNVITGNQFRDNVSVCPSAPGWYPSSSTEIYGGSRNRFERNRTVGDRVFAELGSSRERIATGNVFAYNLFVTDRPGSRFIITRGREDTRYGPVPGTTVVHNTTYLTGPDSQGVVCGGGCDRSMLTMTDNVLWAEEKAVYGDDLFVEARNVYWSADGSPTLQLERPGAAGVERWAPSPSSRIGDPGFASTDPGSPASFVPGPGSPAVDAAPPPPAAATDVRARPVPQGPAPDLGAVERPIP